MNDMMSQQILTNLQKTQTRILQLQCLSVYCTLDYIRRIVLIIAIHVHKYTVYRRVCEGILKLSNPCNRMFLESRIT